LYTFRSIFHSKKASLEASIPLLVAEPGYTDLQPFVPLQNSDFMPQYSNRPTVTQLTALHRKLCNHQLIEASRIGYYHRGLIFTSRDLNEPKSSCKFRRLGWWRLWQIEYHMPCLQKAAAVLLQPNVALGVC
jgi:hypothetical protein